jgi:hypothetical protein
MSKAIDEALKAVEEGRVPPLFCKGEIVAVYDDPHQAILIAYGKITDMRWSEAVFDWYYDILTVYHHTTITHLQAQIRLISPNEARQLFVLVRNPLDSP